MKNIQSSWYGDHRPYQIHKTDEEHFLDNIKPLKPRQSKKRKTNISRAQEGILVTVEKIIIINIIQKISKTFQSLYYAI